MLYVALLLFQRHMGRFGAVEESPVILCVVSGSAMPVVVRFFFLVQSAAYPTSLAVSRPPIPKFRG